MRCSSGGWLANSSLEASAGDAEGRHLVRQRLRILACCRRRNAEIILSRPRQVCAARIRHGTRANARTT